MVLTWTDWPTGVLEKLRTSISAPSRRTRNGVALAVMINQPTDNEIGTRHDQ
jgi:hypothetical protein